MSSSLPRSLDVQISVSRPQAETRTNLSVLCVVCTGIGDVMGDDRIRYYTGSTVADSGLSTDFVSGTEPYKAGLAFFAQSPRPVTLAIGYATSSDDIQAELDELKAAANTAGINVYGWVLSATLRVAATQEAAAAWALGQTAFMVLTTNDVNALDSGYTTDIGSVIKATTNKRARCLYHNDPLQYPDVSILAYLLSVNYQLQDSTVTAKFKQLPGITTVPLTTTQWATLQSKGYDSYTAIGNNAQTYRDGGTEDPSWFMDSVINLDNFVEDLSVNVLNVFLRNKKVPYTRPGQMLLVDACTDTGTQYTYNGSFADRLVADATSKSGTATLPAVAVLATPIQNMTTADRASRIGPPIQMIVQEAGAIHSVAVAVNVVS